MLIKIVILKEFQKNLFRRLNIEIILCTIFNTL